MSCRNATFVSLVLLAVFGLWGCGAESEATSAEQLPEVTAPLEAIDIRITSNDQMLFDVTRFTVASGQTVRLTLDHIGKLPASAMGHNVVILKSNVDAAVWAGAVSRSGGSMANEWVPEPMRGDVVAFTRMLGGGESDTIEFTAPEPGEYPFICSFPGHFMMMRGVMIVE